LTALFAFPVDAQEKRSAQNDLFRFGFRAAGNRLAINHAGFASKTSLGSPP
jgi:hypothetical protein